MRTTIAIFLIAAWAVPAGVSAQNTVYRCGNSYSQSPCAGGKVVEVEDGRSEAQGAQTRSAAERDARNAAVMEKDRLRQDARAAPAYIGVPAAAAAVAAPVEPAKKAAKDRTKEPAKSRAKAGPGKPHKPEQFVAAVPGSAEKAKAARKKATAKDDTRKAAAPAAERKKAAKKA